MPDYCSNSIIDGIRRPDCTHPQSLHCGEISARGTGCDFVGGNHALKSRGKTATSTVSLWVDWNLPASTAQTRIPSVTRNSPAAAKPLTSAWAAWPAPMKPTLIIPAWKKNFNFSGAINQNAASKFNFRVPAVLAQN